MIPQLEQQLPGTGMTVESIEATTVEFAGQEHAGISIVGSLNDVGIYEKQVIIISGDYLFVVTAASYLEDNCDALLANFTALAE